MKEQMFSNTQIKYNMEIFHYLYHQILSGRGELLLEGHCPTEHFDECLNMSLEV